MGSTLRVDLGVRLAELGRREEALPPTVEAADIYRGLAATNPAVRPDLANALTNLGRRLAALGRLEEALPPTVEAVDLIRGLAATNPAFQDDFAAALTNLGVRLAELGRRGEALPPTVEAVEIYRGLAAANPAFRPGLARALNGLGVRLGELGRREEALPPTVEAVEIYRGLAATNPAVRPDLATALTLLGVRLGELGRREEALPPTVEAVEIYRRLVATNPAARPNLAWALTNLGGRLAELGRRDEALPPTVEAVDLIRGLAATNPAFRPGLATALTSLGVRLGELGRREEALPRTVEAVDTYRGLAATNPAFRPGLAGALNSLGVRLAELGRGDEVDVAWIGALSRLEPPAQRQAELLLYRASYAEAGDPAVAGRVVDALDMVGDHRELAAALRDEGRRHRAADPAGFDTAWREHTGQPVPSWLVVDSELLALAGAWVSTPSLTAEGDHMIAHPHLLDPVADTAVEEVLLRVPEDDANRYRKLREIARTAGVEAAYRPLALRVLALEFAAADPAVRRDLLDRRRTDLLDEQTVAVLTSLSEHDNSEPAQQARALLDVAAEPAWLEVLDQTLTALAEPDRVPGLLQQTARRPDPNPLDPVARCLRAAATADTDTARATFYLAVAATLRGDDGHASEALDAARRLDPDARDTWVAEIADIGHTHPTVLDLIPALLAPPHTASLDSSDNSAEDAAPA